MLVCSESIRPMLLTAAYGEDAAEFLRWYAAAAACMDEPSDGGAPPDVRAVIDEAVAVGVALLVCGNWMIAEIIAFTNDMFARIPALLSGG